MTTREPARDPLREEAAQVLTNAGYTRLDSTFEVGQIDLEIEDAFEGPPGTLSLAVLVERPMTREEASRAYWTVQRLVRALDAQGSRRSVTVVLLGRKVGDSGFSADLQSVARVLVVDGSLPASRTLSPLMGIEPTPGLAVGSNGLDRLQQTLASNDYGPTLRSFITTASKGAPAVESELIDWLESALSAPATEVGR